MSTFAVEKKKYTYEDYLKTPDDERYELIGGELLMTPAPKTEHQRISRRLAIRMIKFVDDNSLGEIFYAPCDIYFDEENTVQPDILFVSRDRLNIIGENNIQGAPDLIVEVLSEGTAYRDTIRKKMLYARFGVLEYWIAAPQEKMIELYSLENKTYQLIKTYFYNDTLESRILRGFKFELKYVF